MSSISPAAAREWTTEHGLEILNEVCLALLECRLVLNGVKPHLALTLDDLDRDLRALQQSAREAYEAAFLLKMDAQLVAGWSTHPARPRAVRVRHGFAVQGGAPLVIAEPSSADRIEITLERLRSSNPVPPSAGRRCAAYLKSAGRPC
jgi:hypothetical protein